LEYDKIIASLSGDLIRNFIYMAKGRPKNWALKNIMEGVLRDKMTKCFTEKDKKKSWKLVREIVHLKRHMESL